MARLMTGDVAGADSIAKQGSGELASSAEWLWVSGRRKEAYTKLAAQAAGSDESRSAGASVCPSRGVGAAAESTAGAAAEMAQKAASVGAQLMAGTVAAVRVRDAAAGDSGRMGRSRRAVLSERSAEFAEGLCAGVCAACERPLRGGGSGIETTGGA